MDSRVGLFRSRTLPLSANVAALNEEGRHTISMVTMTELQPGVVQYEGGSPEHSRALDDLERLLSRFDILLISRPVAPTAAKIIARLKSGGELLDDLHDVYIAAIGRTQDIPVVTANIDHFDRIDDLRVIDWADL